MTPHVRAVNVVHAVVPDTRGDLDTTAIDKRPVTGPVRVGTHGLEGDVQVDTRHHGGRDKAVYSYAREDLDWWEAELGRELTDGCFGENLTTSGLDVTGAVIGERWRIGSAGLVLEVTMPRIPCATFQGWLDEPRWVKRFYAHGVSGAYLRVLEQGSVVAGDPVEVVHRPAHGVTIAEAFTQDPDPDRLRLLLDEQDDLSPDLVRPLRRRVAAADKAARAAR